MPLGGPVDDLPHAPGAVRVGLEDLLPHRREVGQHPALAGVLLRDLQLDRLVGVLHAAEHRVEGLAGLEVQRAVLGLQEDVVGEAALVVDRAELHVSPLEPVVVEVGVVDERAPVDLHAQRRDRRRDAVGAVAVVVAEVLRARLALGVGLDGEAHEVRDRGLQLLRLARPPAAEGRAVGVELLVGQRVRREPRVGRRRVVDRQRDPDAVRAQRVGQRGLLRDVGRRQVDVVGVDQVDLDAVEPDRRHRARDHDVAVEDHRQVAAGARAGGGEVEDRPVLAVEPARAVGVVARVQARALPVVEVAVLDPRRGVDVQAVDRLLRLHAPQEGERAVEGADLGLAGDHGHARDRPDHVALVTDRGEVRAGDVLAHRRRALAGADDHGAVADRVRHRHGLVQQPAEPADELVARRLEARLHQLLGGPGRHAQVGRVPVDLVRAGVLDDDRRRRAPVALAQVGVADRHVAQPQLRAVVDVLLRRCGRSPEQHREEHRCKHAAQPSQGHHVPLCVCLQTNPTAMLLALPEVSMPTFVGSLDESLRAD